MSPFVRFHPGLNGDNIPPRLKGIVQVVAEMQVVYEDREIALKHCLLNWHYLVET